MILSKGSATVSYQASEVVKVDGGCTELRTLILETGVPKSYVWLNLGNKANK